TVALLAVLTAYCFTLASSMGAPTEFFGPMAKQHRMALTTFACLLCCFVNNQNVILSSALIILAIGCIITCWRRLKAAYEYLEGK
ncbi:MAG: CDP-alcohol phosphatidyltransferase family protein, partial [Lentisphaeraceae bacterium]|nr:CDP-alcohol phosphatidyltransferase family protein [Lentisphaeraceae bacterium]